MIEFMRTMFVNGKGLAAWIALLMAANMVGPLLFINTLEGQVVLAAAAAGAFAQTALFAAKGFVRLVGIGHVFWVPLIPWLWSRLDELPPSGPFGYWVAAVMILNSISLLIDVTDVVRYMRGDRTPHLRSHA
jgi:hypothetical protein